MRSHNVVLFTCTFCDLTQATPTSRTDNDDLFPTMQSVLLQATGGDCAIEWLCVTDIMEQSTSARCLLTEVESLNS